MHIARQTPVFVIALGICLSLVFYVHRVAYSVPKQFPVGATFTVNENESLKSVSIRLRREGYVTSGLFFRAALSLVGRDTALKLGGYTFDKPMSLVDIVRVFAYGKPSSPLLILTVPEGSTTYEIASRVIELLPSLSGKVFVEHVASLGYEGKLFPSTYFLRPSYTEDDIIRLMNTTFTKKTSEVFALYGSSTPFTHDQMLVLASILEGEAKTETDMRIVSGILYKRLSIGMPLQVDVAPETYRKKGLPTLPINNPGLVAITAALLPTSSPYLYYITGRDGKMYYAETFTEHKRNIAKYLR